jgi:pilus assembly protein CpaE
LRASYTHLILDLSKRFTPTDLMGLRMADVILLIAQLELTSLRNIVRMLFTLSAEEGMEQKIKVVINRVGSDTVDGEISLKKAEETSGRSIYFQVPDDYRSMMGSRNAGVPLLQHAPRSKLCQSVVQLAQVLCGKEEVDAKKKRNGFFSFK